MIFFYKALFKPLISIYNKDEFGVNYQYFNNTLFIIRSIRIFFAPIVLVFKGLLYSYYLCRYVSRLFYVLTFLSTITLLNK